MCWGSLWIFLSVIATYSIDAEEALSCCTGCQCNVTGEMICSGLEEVPHTCIPENVKVLVIQDSPKLKSLPRGVYQGNNLKELRFIRTGLERIDEGAFRGLNMLEILEISSSDGLIDIDNKVFADTSNVKTLILSGNKQFRELEANQFAFLPSLKHVDVSLCDLKNIDEYAFDSCRNITHLNISGNKNLELLKRKTFTDLVSLEEMDMHGCRLRTLYPEQINPYYSSGTLEKFTADDNRWQCDQEMCEFMTWLQDNYSFRYRAEMGTCYEPKHWVGTPVLALNAEKVCHHPNTAVLTFVGIICFSVLLLACCLILALKNCFSGLFPSEESLPTSRHTQSRPRHRRQTTSSGVPNQAMEREVEGASGAASGGKMGEWNINDVEPPSYELVMRSNGTANEESRVSHPETDSIDGIPPPEYSERTPEDSHENHIPP